MEQFNPFTLVGKHILVTGASSGIGKGIALACAKMGATVIVTGRNVERLNETLNQLPEGNHKAISADLTKAEDIDRLVSELPKLGWSRTMRWCWQSCGLQDDDTSRH